MNNSVSPVALISPVAALACGVLIGWSAAHGSRTPDGFSLLPKDAEVSCDFTNADERAATKCLRLADGTVPLFNGEPLVTAFVHRQALRSQAQVPLSPAGWQRFTTIMQVPDRQVALADGRLLPLPLQGVPVPAPCNRETGIAAVEAFHTTALALPVGAGDGQTVLDVPVNDWGVTLRCQDGATIRYHLVAAGEMPTEALAAPRTAGEPALKDIPAVQQPYLPVVQGPVPVQPPAAEPGQ